MMHCPMGNILSTSLSTSNVPVRSGTTRFRTTPKWTGTCRSPSWAKIETLLMMWQSGSMQIREAFNGWVGCNHTIQWHGKMCRPGSAQGQSQTRWLSVMTYLTLYRRTPGPCSSSCWTMPLSHSRQTAAPMYFYRLQVVQSRLQARIRSDHNPKCHRLA